MDNVPSSAILAIIAIVAACLLGAFIFTTVQSQKEAGNKAVSKVESMNASLDEAQLTQYDQVDVTGSQVVSAIKMLADEHVSIVVENGNPATASDNAVTTTVTKDAAEVAYNYTLGSDGTLTTVGDAERAEALKGAKNKSLPSYITPSSKYTGKVFRNAATGAINQVVFTKVAR